MRERGLHGFVARRNRPAWGKLLVVGCQAEEIRSPAVMISSRFSDQWFGTTTAIRRPPTNASGRQRKKDRHAATSRGHVSRLKESIGQEETRERGRRRGRRRQKNGLDGARRLREKGRGMASVASVAHAWRRWGRCLARGRVAFVRPRPSEVPAGRNPRPPSQLEDQRVGFGDFARAAPENSLSAQCLKPPHGYMRLRPDITVTLLSTSAGQSWG
jgi:hypothetical protein